MRVYTELHERVFTRILCFCIEWLVTLIVLIVFLIFFQLLLHRYVYSLTPSADQNMKENWTT